MRFVNCVSAIIYYFTDSLIRLIEFITGSMNVIAVHNQLVVDHII